MFRKTLIAVAAAGTMALGLGAATTPANAGLKLYIGTPGFYVGGHRLHRHHHGHYHCHVTKVKVKKHGKWRTKRVKACHSHY